MRNFILLFVVVLSACNSQKKVLPFGDLSMELDSKFINEIHNTDEISNYKNSIYKDSFKQINVILKTKKTINIDTFGTRKILIIKNFERAAPCREIEFGTKEIIKNTKNNNKNDSEQASDKLRGWMLLSYLIGLISLLIYTYLGGYFFVIFSAISITAALILSLLVISINQSLWILLMQITGLLNILFLPW